MKVRKREKWKWDRGRNESEKEGEMKVREFWRKTPLESERKIQTKKAKNWNEKRDLKKLWKNCWQTEQTNGSFFPSVGTRCLEYGLHSTRYTFWSLGWRGVQERFGSRRCSATLLLESVWQARFLLRSFLLHRWIQWRQSELDALR